MSYNPQFSYVINDTNNLEETLQEVRDHLDKTAFSAVLTHLYSGYTDRMRLEMVVRAIKNILPETHVVGATAGGEIHEGVLAPRGIVMVISVFENAQLDVREYKIKSGEEVEYGKLIKEAIDSTPEIKAAELLVDCARLSTAVLFPEISKCLFHVQIYGAVPYAHDLTKPMFILTSFIKRTRTRQVL